MMLMQKSSGVGPNTGDVAETAEALAPTPAALPAHGNLFASSSAPPDETPSSYGSVGVQGLLSANHHHAHHVAAAPPLPWNWLQPQTPSTLAVPSTCEDNTPVSPLSPFPQTPTPVSGAANVDFRLFQPQHLFNYAAAAAAAAAASGYPFTNSFVKSPPTNALPGLPHPHTPNHLSLEDPKLAPCAVFLPPSAYAANATPNNYTGNTNVSSPTPYPSPAAHPYSLRPLHQQSNNSPVLNTPFLLPAKLVPELLAYSSTPPSHGSTMSTALLGTDSSYAVTPLPRDATYPLSLAGSVAATAAQATPSSCLNDPGFNALPSPCLPLSSLYAASLQQYNYPSNAELQLRQAYAAQALYLQQHHQTLLAAQQLTGAPDSKLDFMAPMFPTSADLAASQQAPPTTSLPTSPADKNVSSSASDASDKDDWSSSTADDDTKGSSPATAKHRPSMPYFSISTFEDVGGPCFYSGGIPPPLRLCSVRRLEQQQTLDSKETSVSSPWSVETNNTSDDGCESVVCDATAVVPTSPFEQDAGISHHAEVAANSLRPPVEVAAEAEGGRAVPSEYDDGATLSPCLSDGGPDSSHSSPLAASFLPFFNPVAEGQKEAAVHHRPLVQQAECAPRSYMQLSPLQEATTAVESPSGQHQGGTGRDSVVSDNNNKPSQLVSALTSADDGQQPAEDSCRREKGGEGGEEERRSRERLQSVAQTISEAAVQQQQRALRGATNIAGLSRALDWAECTEAEMLANRSDSARFRTLVSGGFGELARQLTVTAEEDELAVQQLVVGGDGKGDRGESHEGVLGSSGAEETGGEVAATVSGTAATRHAMAAEVSHRLRGRSLAGRIAPSHTQQQSGLLLPFPAVATADCEALSPETTALTGETETCGVTCFGGGVDAPASAKSQGSTLHPDKCKPCAFFWSKGCTNGENCRFCHEWHAPKRKKPMKEQRNLMIIARPDGKTEFIRCSLTEALRSCP